ncbi:UNVERIFIED_CONTAM: zinc ribbon domain-containing protein, partial [Aerococcus urinaeequi]
ARYEHHSWRFFDFEEKLMYKALESGSQVLKVSAQFTSQRCPKCESIDRANRQQDKHLFTCQIQQFSQNAYKFGQAELLCRKGKWFLHVSASKEIDSPDETNIQRIVGIDRGLRQILTIADDTAH